MSASDARPAGKLRIWGLTGGVAAGKSTVARLLEREGLPVVDADQVARELSAPGGAAYEAIVARFGTADRARLREKVFADPAARRELEAILHPLIVVESERRFRALADAFAGDPARFVAVYEAALLVETGRWRDFEGLIVVSAPTAVRRQRLIERDGHSPELADRILAAQIPDSDRRRVATVVIENDADRAELERRVRHVARRILMIEA